MRWLKYSPKARRVSCVLRPGQFLGGTVIIADIVLLALLKDCWLGYAEKVRRVIRR